MALSQPFACTDLTYPFSALRMQMGSLASAGVVHSGDMVVSPSSGLQVQIAAGEAYVTQTVAPEDSFFPNNSLYYMWNDAPANPYNTILAPVSNPRIDQMILRVYDVQEQGLSGTSKAQFEWLPGTESASASLATMGPGKSNPGAAALPANSLQLSYVLQTVGESSITSGNILNVVPALGKPSGFLQGTLANRPPAGLAGRVYYATDTNQWFLDTGSAWQQDAPGAGFEWAYTQITANVQITAVTSPYTTVLTLPTFTADGAPVIFEFFAPVVQSNQSGDQTILYLFEGATQIAELTVPEVSTIYNGYAGWPMNLRYRFVPTAGSHTYTVQASHGIGAATAYVVAGAAGAAPVPAFARITKV